MRYRGFTKQPSAASSFFSRCRLRPMRKPSRLVVNFGKTNGADPSVGLVQGRDGNFYGTMYEEGTLGLRHRLSLTPAGKLTTIYNFCSQTSCTDAHPGAPRCSWFDGNFYGTTGNGGTSEHCTQQECSTVFKITSQGQAHNSALEFMKPTETYGGGINTRHGWQLLRNYVRGGQYGLGGLK